MATILLSGVDLLLRSRLEGLLPGHRLVTTADEPDLVICDIGRVDVDELAASWSGTPILGFTNHTDTEGLRHAHSVGFAQVVAKSALIERGAGLVEALIADG